MTELSGLSDKQLWIRLIIWFGALFLAAFIGTIAGDWVHDWISHGGQVCHK